MSEDTGPLVSAARMTRFRFDRKWLYGKDNFFLLFWFHIQHISIYYIFHEAFFFVYYDNEQRCNIHVDLEVLIKSVCWDKKQAVTIHNPNYIHKVQKKNKYCV